MTAAQIIGAVVGSFGLAYASVAATNYFFPGSTPTTISNKEWAKETDRKFQAWPRTAGPPVVMNPISRQNYIVKSRAD